MKSILLPLLFMTSTMIAQEPDTSSALFRMREAERNFARTSVMIGRNAAFTEFFADESVIFTDKWITNGRQFWRERKVVPLVLKWEPEFMDISESRDFGISTGPSEAQEYRPGTAPLSTGYFLSVWKKQQDGNWKVALDAGSLTPPPIVPEHSFSFPAGADKPVANPGKYNIKSLSDDLIERENQILNAWKNSPTNSIYFTFLGQNARIQKNGHLPSTNRDTINIWIKKLDKTLIWKSSGSGAASSGDLGFTYGILEKSGDPDVTKGHYVRIWRKKPDDKWYIILEMMNMDK